MAFLCGLILHAVYRVVGDQWRDLFVHPPDNVWLDRPYDHLSLFDSRVPMAHCSASFPSKGYPVKRERPPTLSALAVGSLNLSLANRCRMG